MSKEGKLTTKNRTWEEHISKFTQGKLKSKNNTWEEHTSKGKQTN